LATESGKSCMMSDIGCGAGGNMVGSLANILQKAECMSIRHRTVAILSS
jgi:hypothetical protein